MLLLTDGGCCRLVGVVIVYLISLVHATTKLSLLQKLWISAPPTPVHRDPTIRNEMGRRPVILVICENGGVARHPLAGVGCTRDS